MTHDTRVALDAGAIGRTLDDIAQIGNRFCGTPGEAQARSYVLGRFGELGLADVRLEEFPYLGWQPGPASCVAHGPGAGWQAYDAHPLQYTAPGPVSGEAIYLGGAEPEDFARLEAAGVDLAGRIAVAHAVFPFDLGELLSERGIAGFVHVCETPDAIVGNFTGALYPPPLAPPWEGRPLPYAGVTIGHLAARELISTLTCGAPVELTIGHEGGCTPATTANVVGVIPGTGEEEVVLCAHYDSQAEGPCVYDNGSGLSGLLEAARALRELAPQRRVVLVATSGEELGVWGATAYVDAHRERAGPSGGDDQPRRAGQRVSGPARGVVHPRRAAVAGRADGRGAGLARRSRPPRPQHLLRPRAVRGRRRPVGAVLAPRLPLLPLARRRARAGR